MSYAGQADPRRVACATGTGYPSRGALADDNLLDIDSTSYDSDHTNNNSNSSSGTHVPKVPYHNRSGEVHDFSGQDQLQEAGVPLYVDPNSMLSLSSSVPCSPQKESFSHGCVVTQDCVELLLIQELGDPVRHSSSKGLWTERLRRRLPCNNGFGKCRKVSVPLLLSEGSAGHPFSCAAPCKWARRSKGCRYGASCTSCHVCKWTRATSGLNGWKRSQVVLEQSTGGGLFNDPPSLSLATDGKDEDEAPGVLVDVTYVERVSL